MEISAIEKSRKVEQARLDGLKSLRERNRLGQFSTDLPLSLDIARYVAQLWGERQEPIRFLEPALGTGSFYSAFRQAFPAKCSRATGVESDPPFADSASSLWSDSGLDIVNADFTALTPPAPYDRYNLVLTNPPYVRHHHLSREVKERLKSTVASKLGIDISGLAGLYCHFLLLCDEWLSNGGLAGWLIPSEFMEVNYGTAVKRYLSERVKLIRIHRFSPSDVQFGDALVTSAVVVFEKSAPPPRHEVEMSFGGSLLSPTTCEPIPLSALRSAKKWTGYPSNGQVAEKHAAILGDFFDIKRGIATGSNAFFILGRDEALRKGIPDQFLRPILPSSRHLKVDIIEMHVDGYPKLDRPLAMIDCDLPEEVIKERHPRFWEYLAKGKGQDVHTGYLTSRRTPWYSQEKRAPAPFICTYMGRRKSSGSPFRFFWNKSQAVAANVYLLLYPKGELKKALKDHPELYLEVLSYLQSINADHLIGEGRVYGGGLHKMEPKELASLASDLLLKLIGDPPQPARYAKMLF